MVLRCCLWGSQIHKGNIKEGVWVGEQAGEWKGNKVFVGCLRGQTFLAVNSDVFLRGDSGEDRYIARVPPPSSSQLSVVQATSLVTLLSLLRSFGCTSGGRTELRC